MELVRASAAPLPAAFGDWDWEEVTVRRPLVARLLDGDHADWQRAWALMRGGMSRGC